MEDKIIIDYECITKSATALEGITIDKEIMPNIAQELKTIETEHEGLELNTQALDETAENLVNVDTKIKNLGVKAVLYSIKTDGPEIWNTKKGEINCVNAVFVYKGAEYIYVGGMSNDTMKEFLDSLS